MIRLLLTFYFVFTACGSYGQQVNSAQIMERVRAAMEGSAAFEISFTFSGMEGIIWLQGTDYAMITPQVEVYASGDTKWIYSPEINEAVVMGYDRVSVDLAENPFALFSAHLYRDYQLTNKPNILSEKGQEIAEITLTPTVKNFAYSSILLRINNKTYLPHGIKYNAKDGSWVEVFITDVQARGQKYPPERFLFSVTEHPGVYITDLR